MRYRVIAPPAFRVYLRRENGYRGIHAPGGVSGACKRRPVLLRRAGYRHLGGMSQAAQKAQGQPEAHTDGKARGHKFDTQPETFPKGPGQMPG